MKTRPVLNIRGEKNNRLSLTFMGLTIEKTLQLYIPTKLYIESKALFLGY